MKPFRLLFTVTTLTWILLFAFTGQTVRASGKPVAAPTVDPRKLVQSVNAAVDTVVIVYMRDNTTHTYAVDNFTTIMVNHASAKISDIKTGMQVRDFIERDGKTLDSITVDKADPAPRKAK